MWYRHQESNEAEKLLGFFVLFLRGGLSPQWLKPLLSDPHPLLALPLPAAPIALLTMAPNHGHSISGSQSS